MIALDPADLVVIAGRTLGIGADAALAQMDIAAAQDALAEARPPGLVPLDRAAAAAAGVGLVRALLRHRPFPRHGQQVAVAAGLQFLSLNGWRADLSPPATAAVVVEALASGRLAPDDAAAWLSPRLTRLGRPRPALHTRPLHSVWPAPVARPPSRTRSLRPGRSPLAGPQPGQGRPMPRPAARVPVRRAVAGALLAIAVSGVALLSAACSRGPAAPAVPAGGTTACASACASTQSPP